MEPSPLAIVVNPRAAGGREGGRRAERLRRIAGARAALFVTEDRGLVDAVAQGVRERGARAIAVVGGDGTVCSVLSALHRAYGEAPLPPLALLRGGTMNTVADALGVSRGRPERLLGSLLAALPSEGDPPFVERGTLCVEERVGFLFSAGVMAGFLERLYAERPGRLAALSLLLRGSARAMLRDQPLGFESPLDATLTIDGVQQVRREYGALGAGTVEQVGLGFRPYPRAAERPDRFQVFAFAGNMRKLAVQLPRLRAGATIPEHLGFAPLARELIVHSHGGPISYAIDGELVRSGPSVAVALGPRVRVIAL